MCNTFRSYLIISRAYKYGLKGEIQRMTVYPMPQDVVVDFEKGLWKALKSIYSAVSIRQCAFHWSQTVYRKIQNLGYIKDYQSNMNNRRTTLSKILALPFLSSFTLPTMFNLIENEMKTANRYSDLEDNVRSQWIENSIWQLQQWSVIGFSIRKNNEVEAWHRRDCETPTKFIDLYFLDKFFTYSIKPLVKDEYSIYGKLQIQISSINQLENVAFQSKITDNEMKMLCKRMGYDGIHFIAQACPSDGGKFFMELTENYLIKSKTFGFLPMKFKMTEDFINIGKAICKLSGELPTPNSPIIIIRTYDEIYLEHCPLLNQHLHRFGNVVLDNCKWDNSDLWGCELLDTEETVYTSIPNCVKKENFTKVNAVCKYFGFLSGTMIKAEEETGLGTRELFSFKCNDCKSKGLSYTFEESCFYLFSEKISVSIKDSSELCKKRNMTLPSYITNEAEYLLTLNKQFEYILSVEASDKLQPNSKFRLSLPGTLKTEEDVKGRKFLVFDDGKPFELRYFQLLRNNE
ncbi:DgyrCDS14943 [Dimorphilus gyrociliatus]|uniref:DgyrCDS14943 n=1 Tax=Dimorphilus gyrociliatus TaxID=2664684 RepID=A0A7I8WFE6_9ANNE|nr:DgyrCDS14943 [Dimorphilus gyrociliatus]